jgi:restriction system protein
MNNDPLISFYLVILSLFILFLLAITIHKKNEEKKYHKKLSQSGIRDIDKMDGFQFEVYLKSLFKELGYKTKVTKNTSDFGADLILEKNGKKTVVQAKRYKYKNNVGLEAVQQVYTAIPYYKANRACVITNSQYTKNAKVLAGVCNVELIDRRKLINLISKINPSVTPERIKKTVPPKKRKCPKCSNSLVIRYNKKGDEFFGCSDFPNCKHTESIAN